MSTNTTNYNLAKPTENETADINIINDNMDIIDQTLKTIKQEAEDLDTQNVKLGGEQILTGVKIFPALISNGDSNHLQFFRNFTKEWHMEALENQFSIVQSGVAERISISKDGNVSINGALNVSAPTLESHAANKQYVDENKYVHPTNSGNKHVPSGGTVGQILKNTSSGTATWQDLVASETLLSASTQALYGVSNVDAVLQNINARLVGSVMWYTKSSPPDGYLLCNGGIISRTTYSKLFAVVGTTFGMGDGSTTFNIPDLRGCFIRGVDNSRGVAVDATLATTNSGTVLTSGSVTDEVVTGVTNYDSMTSWEIKNGWKINSSSGSGNNGTGNTFNIRPYNMALLPCIKY